MDSRICILFFVAHTYTQGTRSFIETDLNPRLLLKLTGPNFLKPLQKQSCYICNILNATKTVHNRIKLLMNDL